MRLFLFWWCFDDHLASALGNPGIGHVPLWVMLLVGLVTTGLIRAGAA